MPLIPLTEAVGNVGTVLPAQIVCEVPKLKLGVRMGLTVTVKVTGAIHCSGVAVGVKV